MSTAFKNRTRESASIPLALLRRGRVLEIPLYYVLRLSDLAREGLDYSGSHRFADHIYRNQPSGAGPLGRGLDAMLLSLPAVRSFRSRYLAARETIAALILERLARDDGPIRVLSAPCGIPRELADAADAVRQKLGSLPARVEWHGLDLDPDVLAEATAFMSTRGIERFRAHRGNALSPGDYPRDLTAITCTGLAEFLDDAELSRVYAACHAALAEGGTLITSGMQRRRLSDYLLRLAEIRTHYRGPDDLRRLARQVPFRSVDVRTDAIGLQSILTAIK